MFCGTHTSSPSPTDVFCILMWFLWDPPAFLWFATSRDVLLSFFHTEASFLVVLQLTVQIPRPPNQRFAFSRSEARTQDSAFLISRSVDSYASDLRQTFWSVSRFGRKLCCSAHFTKNYLSALLSNWIGFTEMPVISPTAFLPLPTSLWAMPVPPLCHLHREPHWAAPPQCCM